MTFYTILSLAPMLMVAVAIAGYMYDGPEVQAEIVEQIERLTDERTARTVAGLLRNATQPQAGLVAGSISLAISLFGASGVFSQLYETFNDIWDVPSESRSGWIFMVQKRLIGIGVVVVVGVLLLATLAIGSVLAYLNTLVQESMPQLEFWLKLADQGLLYLLMPVVFAAMFWFFPAAKVKVRDVWPAGVLTAVLVAGSRLLVETYLRFSSTSEVYGAAGSLVVLLIWIYIIGMCLFFGASFCYAYAEIRAEDMGESTVPEPTDRSADVSGSPEWDPAAAPDRVTLIRRQQ